MGIKLKRVSAGEYVTEDGRYKIEKGVGITDCDDAHPVRFSRTQREQARGSTSHIPPAGGGWTPTAWFEARMGRKGYLCPGGEDHAYDSWGVWDVETDDYVTSAHIDFRTKKEAVEALEQYLNDAG